jgi:hypothetical protein
VREQLEELIGGRRDEGVGSPERALMRAMLQDAVMCLFGEAAPTSERTQLVADARYWIRSCSREWIFSFESVCDGLGIDPDYARDRLLKMAEARSSGAAAVPGAQVATPVRGVRGLRRCGQRPRRAIHFLSERRRRRAQVSEV